MGLILLIVLLWFVIFLTDYMFVYVITITVHVYNADKNNTSK